MARWLEEKGQALIELAITAPLLLFLFIAALSLADANQKKNLVAKAAIQGARLAVVKSSSEVESYVRKYLKTAEPTIDLNKVKTKIEPLKIPIVSKSIIPLKVTVTYEHSLFFGFGWSPEIALEKSYIVEKWDNGIITDIPARED